MDFEEVLLFLAGDAEQRVRAVVPEPGIADDLVTEKCPVEVGVGSGFTDGDGSGKGLQESG